MGYAARLGKNEPDYKARQAAARVVNFRVIEEKKPGRWSWAHYGRIGRREGARALPRNWKEARRKRRRMARDSRKRNRPAKR